MNWNRKKIAGSFLLAFILVLSCYYLLDRRIALFVKKVFTSDGNFLSADIPDFLFVFVSAVSVIASSAYLYFTNRGEDNVHRRFSRLLAVAIPVAFIVKSILKWIVGRIDARFWVQYPRATHFHWLHGYGNYTSFPSGHMAVFTAFFIAVSRYYPQYRYACFGLLSILALALILTNYHFVGDVIAGAYIGVMVVYFTDRYCFVRSGIKESDSGG